MNKLYQIPVYGLMAVFIMSCAAGGGETGTGFDHVAQGKITRFGSVYVNGVKYETHGSDISVDGVLASESDLAIGMVVTLVGNLNDDGVTGTAGHVSFSDSVEGIVTANSYLVDQTITVMDQTVKFTPNTVYDDDAGLGTPDLITASYTNGAIVEVSGFSAGNGEIHATRVKTVKADFVAGSDTIELKGYVSNHNGNSFNIGALSISYTSAEEPLSDGRYVEVKSQDGYSGTILLASDVKPVKDPSEAFADRDQKVEVEGIVTSVTAGADYDFMLNAFRVKNASDTVITLNTQLEVEGYFNSAGILVVEDIEQRTENNTEIQAYVELVNTGANTVTLLGQVWHVNNLTTLKDERDMENSIEVQPVEKFDLSYLNINERIKAKGYYDSTSGLHLLTYLERENDDQGALLFKGPVTNLSPLGIAGVEINLNGLTVPSGTALGSIVEVNADWTGYDSNSQILTISAI